MTRKRVPNEVCCTWRSKLLLGSFTLSLAVHAYVWSLPEVSASILRPWDIAQQPRVLVPNERASQQSHQNDQYHRAGPEPFNPFTSPDPDIFLEGYPPPLRTAVLFTGELRTIGLLWPSWERHIVEPNDADLFWSIGVDFTKRSDREALLMVQNLKRTVAIHVEDYSPDKLEDLFWTVLNETEFMRWVPQYLNVVKANRFSKGFSVDMFRLISKGVNLVKANGGLENYDALFRVRCDLAVYMPYRVKKEDLSTGIAIPNCDNFNGGINDRFWIGTPKLMWELFHSLTWYSKLNHDHDFHHLKCCEGALLTYLNDHNVEPKRFPLAYGTVKEIFAYYWWIHHNAKISIWHRQVCDVRLESRPSGKVIYGDYTTWVQMEQMFNILESYNVRVRPWGTCAGYPCLKVNGTVANRDDDDIGATAICVLDEIPSYDHGHELCLDHQELRYFLSATTNIPRKYRYGSHPTCARLGQFCLCYGTVRMRTSTHAKDVEGVAGHILCSPEVFDWRLTLTSKKWWKLEVLRPLWCECYPDLSVPKSWQLWDERSREWRWRTSKDVQAVELEEIRNRTYPFVTSGFKIGTWYFREKGPDLKNYLIHYNITNSTEFPLTLENVGHVEDAYYADQEGKIIRGKVPDFFLLEYNTGELYIPTVNFGFSSFVIRYRPLNF